MQVLYRYTGNKHPNTGMEDYRLLIAPFFNLLYNPCFPPILPSQCLGTVLATQLSPVHEYLPSPKVPGRLGVETSVLAPKYANQGAQLSGYFWNGQVGCREMKGNLGGGILAWQRDRRCKGRVPAGIVRI